MVSEEVAQALTASRDQEGSSGRVERAGLWRLGGPAWIPGDPGLCFPWRSLGVVLWPLLTVGQSPIYLCPPRGMQNSFEKLIKVLQFEEVF